MGRVRNDKRLNVVLSYMRQYLLNSTLHGVRYTVLRWGMEQDNGQKSHLVLFFLFSNSYCGRLCWVALTLTSTVFCLYLVGVNVIIWKTQPFVTALESVSINELQFPAVTVCLNSQVVDISSLEKLERLIQFKNNSKIRAMYAKVSLT